MKEIQRNILVSLLILVLLVLVVFPIIILNKSCSLSNNVLERFETSSAPSKDLDHLNIKSIVSKKNGKMFNIKFLKNDPDNKTIFIESPISINANLSVNTNGLLSEELKSTSNINQQFTITNIANDHDYRRELNIDDISNSSVSQCIDYPFYLIRSKKFDNWMLTYDNNRLIVLPKGNREDQKWDVSDIKIPKNVCTHTNISTDFGGINKVISNNNNVISDPDKIKLQFDLDDELRNKLFGTSEIEKANQERLNYDDFYNQKCDNYLPKKAISSICPGCDPNK